jgi:hypothetical protein
LLQTKLQLKVDNAKTNGKGTADMEADLVVMAAKTASAKAATSGLVTKLLALQPTNYNADHAVLSTYWQSLASARADIKAARDAASSVLNALKAVE